MKGVAHNFYKFEVIENTPLGRACIAKDDIQEGEIICKMIGPIISGKEFIDKYEFNECNVLQVGEDEFIDLIEPYVFFNHSCDPNAGLRNSAILVAIRKISKGEEIYYDYSMSVDDVTWSMECKCRAHNCRKIIGDFQSVPHEQKMEYYNKNALTKYIKSTYF